MKSVLIHFEDAEHAALVKRKGKQSWRKFVLRSAGDGSDALPRVKKK